MAELRVLECYDSDLDLPTLRDWEAECNAVSPHQALEHQTPHAHLDHLSVS